jgi:hypothetical protein
MRVVASLLVLLLAMVLTGCEPEFPTFRPFEGPETFLTAEDISVFDAIVSAYAAGELFVAPPSPPPLPKEGAASNQPAEPVRRRWSFAIAPETMGGPDMADMAAWLSTTTDRWMTPSGADRLDIGQPHSAIHDFGARNRRSISLESYTPPAGRVGDDPGRPARLDLTLPGYSPNAGVAVLVVQSGFAGQGSGSLVYLRKVEGVWKVVARQVIWVG